MQFPESWLREFCDPALSTQALADALTMAGLEVEEIRPVAPEFSNVVVGLITAIEAHPKADRLRICQVDVGESAPLSIVCGAPNAEVGMKVPCAKLGAQLPPSEDGKAFEIKPVKLMGVESLGMLCSAKELKISEEHGGLYALPEDAQIGANVREVLHLDDVLFTLKLTPNLAHCLSIYGVAREVSAITKTPLKPLAIAPVPVTSDEHLEVGVQAPDLCGRFSGRVLRGLNPQAKTPQWMLERLARCGQRGVSPLVDISNYVMFEYGQPTHIFDLDRIKAPLSVRWGHAEEKIVLLNEQAIVVDGEVGVIADQNGIESLAGIMGGLSTAVGDSTQAIYIEAAFWWPQSVAGRSRRFNFATDAGHRFERGVDPQLTTPMIERITQLIFDICGTPSTTCGPIDDQLINVPKPQALKMRFDRARKVIGMNLSNEQMFEALSSLGLAPQKTSDALLVTPPSFRFDLQIEEDLIEEVIRCVGYDQLPTTAPLAPITGQLMKESLQGDFTLRHQLAGLGYQETINYSFVEREWLQDMTPEHQAIELLNPIASSMNVMRTTLMPSLLQVYKFNVDRKLSDVRVFEIGRVFFKDESVQDSDTTVKGVHQPMRVAGLIAGRDTVLQWSEKERAFDFFDIKADVEALLHPHQASFVPAHHAALHPGRSAQVFLGERSLGWVGELHPKLKQKWGFTHSPLLFELDLEGVNQKTVPSFRPVSKFQAVERDLAVVLQSSISHTDLMKAIWAASTEGYLRDVVLFDIYRPKEPVANLADNERSLAIRLILNSDEATLSEHQIESAVASILKNLIDTLGARLRA
jgi:phenylalanyl-tRNA synthetase beta chain